MHTRRSSPSDTVAGSHEVFVDDFFESPDTVLPDLLDVVVACFEFAPALFLGTIGDRFRGGFGRSLMPLTREEKLVPLDSASLG